ncbi:MAG: putative O-glycosylation ligase, exosortase A system-associated [Planctomycetota bacterium]
MRDLLVALFVLGSLPVSFRRPVLGLMVFSLLAYMRIQDLTWGFARDQRWSLYVALAMFSGFAAMPDKRMPPMTFRTGLLYFLPVWTFLSLLRESGAEAFLSANYVEYAKIVAVALFTMCVVQRREHLRALMWVIGGSFAFFGLKNGAAAILSGGSLYIIRGPGGLLEDNNDFALALAMSIPILVGLATSEMNGYYRKWLRAFVPLTVMSVLATRSRGGFLALGVGTFVMVWRSKSRILGLSIMGLAGVIGLFLLPAEMFERLKTLQNVEEDGSAQGRLRAWAVAGRMIQDKPLLGVGFNRFQRYYLQYGDRVYERADGSRVTHNAYLQIWSECGTPALLAYFSLMALSVLAVQRLRRDAKRIYERSWIISYCTAFEAMMLTFMVGSTFLNRAHFDLIYHYFAIILVFERIARAEMADPLAASRAQRSYFGGALQRVRERGFRARPASSERGFRTTPLDVPTARPRREF